MSDPTSHQASRSYDLYITISVCTFALVTTTVLRIAAKVKYRLSLGWDDYFIVLGTCLNVVANGFNFQATASGFGRHAQFLTFDQLVKAEKYAQIAVVVAAIAIWAVKISICFFLLAIIKGTHVYFVWLIRIIMGFTTASQFVVTLLWGLQAKPLPKLWDPRIPGTRDSAKGFLVVIYIYYACCIATDVFYSLSPVYFLWHIQMSLRRKIPILALTGSGILLTVVAALDIAFAREFLSTEDITWALINLFICDIIERNISGFVANLPALWFLFRQLETSSSASCPPHDTFNHTSIFSEDIQKPTTLSAVVPAKHRQPDPYDLEADDCIPLRQRTVEHSSMHTLSGGSLGNVDGKMARQDPPGVPRGWDDPTLEEGYKRESSEDQN